VEVAVDEGRRHQVAAGVDGLGRLCIDVRAQLGYAAVLDGDVLAGFAGGQGGVAQDQVKYGLTAPPS
jgi:hypothetical protein